jgi:hypothetical protein
VAKYNELHSKIRDPPALSIGTEMRKAREATWPVREKPNLLANVFLPFLLGRRSDHAS